VLPPEANADFVCAMEQVLQPGEPLRYDFEYERRVTANLFMFFEPLAN